METIEKHWNIRKTLKNLNKNRLQKNYLNNLKQPDQTTTTQNKKTRKTTWKHKTI